jgi:alanyl-tRNA synthetase
VFPFVDTHGIPLDVVLDKLREHGLMPDWLEFYESAVKAGWHRERVVHRLEEAVGDVYGPEFREAWSKKFRALIQRGRGG